MMHHLHFFEKIRRVIKKFFLRLCAINNTLCEISRKFKIIIFSQQLFQLGITKLNIVYRIVINYHEKL